MKFILYTIYNFLVKHIQLDNIVANYSRPIVFQVLLSQIHTPFWKRLSAKRLILNSALEYRSPILVSERRASMDDKHTT